MNARGLGLIEVLIASVLLTVTALTAAAVVNNALNSNNVAVSRAQNMVLADAIRTQLARRSTCTNSLIPPPPPYAGNAQVAVDLGGTRVGAGTDLPSYRLSVRSLSIRNLQAFGTTNAGNNVYLADLFMQTQSRPLDGRPAYPLREVLVARLTLEERGWALTGCYANDPNTRPIDQLNAVCNNMASVDGAGGQWINGRCQVPDASGPTKCGQLGGTWTGSRCAVTPNIFTVQRTIGAGSAGNTFYGTTCPAGSSVTGVGCWAQGGTQPPVNTALIGNGAYCWWQSGNESTSFVVQASCSP